MYDCHSYAIFFRIPAALTSPERKTLLPGVVLVDCPEASISEKTRTSEPCYSCFKENNFLKRSFRTEPELSTVGRLVHYGRRAHCGENSAPWEEQRTVGKMAHHGKDGTQWEGWCPGQSPRWVCFCEEGV